MGGTIKKIWSGVTTGIICVVLIFAFLLVGVKIFGLEVFVVKSGSMEPEIRTGSVIYVSEQDSVKDYKVGDVITYYLDEKTLSTHRIVEIKDSDKTESGVAFVTKGDVNDDNDPVPIDPANIVGEYVFGIPFIGYIFAFIKSPPGILTVVSSLMIILMINVILGVFVPDEKKESDAGSKAKEKDSDEN